MATIEVILRDDEGKLICSSKNQTYQVELGRQTLHEIEGGMEAFKQQALYQVVENAHNKAYLQKLLPVEV